MRREGKRRAAIYYVACRVGKGGKGGLLEDDHDLLAGGGSLITPVVGEDLHDVLQDFTSDFGAEGAESHLTLVLGPRM